MKKVLYMHTLDGRPGYFDGEQIVFAEDRETWRDDYYLCVVVESVERINDERTRSEAFRLKHKFDVPKYGYVILSEAAGVIEWTDK